MLWNYYKNGVSQSFINSFLLCKGQTYLNYCEGLVPERYSDAINFGIKGHAILQNSYLQGFPLGQTQTNELLTNLDIVNNEELPLEEDLDRQHDHGVLQVLTNLYFKLQTVVERDFTPEKNWLHIEKRFKIPYLNTFLCGVWDGIFEDEAGGLYIIDHKFLSNPDRWEIEEKLPFDIQVNLYCLAAKILYDKFPKRILYNVIKRPGQRFGKKDTNETFYNRIVKDIDENPSEYFIRINFIPTEEELFDWEKNFLCPVLMEIEDWYHLGCNPRYFNPNALRTYYGKSPYYNYIVTGGSEAGLRRKNVVFEEL